MPILFMLSLGSSCILTGMYFMSTVSLLAPPSELLSCNSLEVYWNVGQYSI